MVPEFAERNKLVLVANMVPNHPDSEPRLTVLEHMWDRNIDIKFDYDPALIFDDSFELAAGDGPFAMKIRELVEFFDH